MTIFDQYSNCIDERRDFKELNDELNPQFIELLAPLNAYYKYQSINRFVID